MTATIFELLLLWRSAFKVTELNHLFAGFDLRRFLIADYFVVQGLRGAAQAILLRFRQWASTLLNFRGDLFRVEHFEGLLQACRDEALVCHLLVALLLLFMSHTGAFGGHRSQNGYFFDSWCLLTLFLILILAQSGMPTLGDNTLDHEFGAGRGHRVDVFLGQGLCLVTLQNHLHLIIVN